MGIWANNGEWGWGNTGNGKSWEMGMGDKEWGKGMRNNGKWGIQEWERRGGEGEIMGNEELGVGDNGKMKTAPSRADPHPDGCDAPALQPCFVAAHEEQLRPPLQEGLL